MEVPSVSVEARTKASTPGFVGRVPVRNLWLLMFDASDLWRHRGVINAAVEDAPDNLPDLVAELLAYAVERRLRRLLSSGYRRRAAALPRVRGRIDMLETERHQLLSRGLVACRFEELAMDTPRNRFIRAACERIAGLVTKPELGTRCRRAAGAMRALGVSGKAPTRREMSTDTIGRHETEDRHMVSAATLALDLTLPMESPGTERLPLAEREDIWVRRLFEHAVRGFYEVTLEPVGWRVGSRRLGWQVEEATPRATSILPGMQTDITLEQATNHRRIVVDTKFTGILTQGQFGQDTLRSGYLYQIYAYVFSQLCLEDPGVWTTEAVLLHPAIGENVDEAAIIQGCRFRFITVDLATDSSKIRDQLRRLVERPHGLSPIEAH